MEAATQTPWAVTTPQYPQKYNTESIAIFATTRTVASNVYSEEISKRCPKVRVVQQACPHLAGAIEAGREVVALEPMVAEHVAALMALMGGAVPDRAILGCTHFPLVEELFRKHLPAHTRLLSQPDVVADSLENYLERHPQYVGQIETDEARPAPLLLTTGEETQVRDALAAFWPEALPFRKVT